MNYLSKVFPKEKFCKLFKIDIDDLDDDDYEDFFTSEYLDYDEVMKKFDGILFVTDLDGTFMASDHITIPQENIDVVMQLAMKLDNAKNLTLNFQILH